MTQDKDSPQSSNQPEVGFKERATSLRLYVRDKQLLKAAKVAAAEDEISLSTLWEQWATTWLESRKR